ncbi:hypothetical protein [Phormidium nigroviride]|uniref:hypothetical protein n=1 Tax=Phormidium nigroviride TaxID=482564 RepID=UPI00167FDC87|nr:hypothetical protein [Oscillatoria nigro-viridis]
MTYSVLFERTLAIRQGIHSLADCWVSGSSCQLKVKPIVRQRLKQQPQSQSPLKED